MCFPVCVSSAAISGHSGQRSLHPGDVAAQSEGQPGVALPDRAGRVRHHGALHRAAETFPAQSLRPGHQVTPELTVNCTPVYLVTWFILIKKDLFNKIVKHSFLGFEGYI